MIQAKVIEDSVSQQGKRLTTLQIQFPRFILPEFNTHRVFSRNFSSSRAIPTRKLLDQVRENPTMPVHWGKNQPGMQAKEELVGDDLKSAQLRWRIAAEQAANNAEVMLECGVHKQVVNRLIEPYIDAHGIVSATEWDNWFELRDHEDAQPEIRALAIAMKEAVNASEPKLLKPGEWHLPYVKEDERNDSFFSANPINHEMLRKISAARCCRVSYLTHEGVVPSIRQDLELCERLAGARPIHASPFEHQATPDEWNDSRDPMMGGWLGREFHGNFVGWVQHRKLIERSFGI